MWRHSGSPDKSARLISGSEVPLSTRWAASVRARLTWILGLFFAVGCLGAAPHERCDHLYAAVFGFIVDPDGKLTHVEFYRPTDCHGQQTNVSIGAAWKKTACVVFSMEEHAPTYKRGEAPVKKYSYFFFDSSRTDVVYPKEAAGSSPDNPVVYVQESILKTELKHPHVCDGNLDAPTAEKADGPDVE